MIKFLNKLGIVTFVLTCVYTPSLLSMDRKDVVPEADALAPKPRECTIASISPIQPNMTPEQARQAIIDFFKANISISKGIILPRHIAKQQLVQKNPEGGFFVLKTLYDSAQPEQPRGPDVIMGNPDAGRIFTLTTLTNDTHWIHGNGGLERFLGALYLQKSLKHHGLTEQWRAVPTKFYLTPNDGPDSTFTITIKSSRTGPLVNVFTINSENFTSFSQYVGNSKFDIDDSSLPKAELKTLTGFSDFPGNVNLVPQEGTPQVTIIDTEYGSFSSDGVTPPSDESELALGGQSFTFTFDELFQ